MDREGAAVEVDQEGQLLGRAEDVAGFVEPRGEAGSGVDDDFPGRGHEGGGARGRSCSG